MRRNRMSRGRSRRSFSRGARNVHRKNLLRGGSLTMRGGIRL